MGLLFIKVAHSDPLPSLPEPPKSNLKESYPTKICSEDIAGNGDLLHVCYVSLETFRENVLENYNKEIIKYISKLKEFDSKLNSLNSVNGIKQKPYKDYIKKVERELFAATNPQGRYLKIYVDFDQKYTNDIRWVAPQLRKAEKQAKKFKK